MDRKFFSKDNSVLPIIFILLISLITASCQNIHNDERISSLSIKENVFIKQVELSLNTLNSKPMNICYFRHQYFDHYSLISIDDDLFLPLNRIDKNISSPAYMDKCKFFDFEKSRSASSVYTAGKTVIPDILGIRIYSKKIPQVDIIKWTNDYNPTSFFLESRKKLIDLCKKDHCESVSKKSLVSMEINFSLCNTKKPHFLFFDGDLLESNFNITFACLVEPLPFQIQDKPKTQ